MSRDATDLKPDNGCVNLRWSLALLDGLIQGGLRQLVLSPGSRSTPVVLAAQRRRELTLTPILDERSAAFFALGMARASAEPVALLATSGSAPAHWYPAVIEAAHWGLPLVLLSADRPPLLRHAGANQTIDQTRLFGAFVRSFYDPGLADDGLPELKAMCALGLRAALRARGGASGREAGPVHLNLPFTAPLVPAGDCPDWMPARTDQGPLGPGFGLDQAPPAPWFSLSRALPAQGRGLMLCGPDSAANATEATAIVQCARHLQLPLLADPLSGLRFAPTPDGSAPDSRPTCRVRHYDALLRNPTAATELKPDWVLRLGLAPVSKTLGEWLTGVPSWLLNAGAHWCDPSHDVQGVIEATPVALASALSANSKAHFPDHDWCARWQLAEQRTAALADAHLGESPWCEAQLIQQLLKAIPADEGLLCANSLPIRQLDTWSYQRIKPLWLFGNRGASGIDGQLSTLAGLNAAGIPTWGLLGDLSFCHDLSGLLLIGKLQRPIIVINNGGGRIFDYLPQHGLPEFERFWRTPVAPNLGELIRPFGLLHQLVQTGDELAAALSMPPTARLIEARVDAERSRAMQLAFWQQVARAPLL